MPASTTRPLSSLVSGTFVARAATVAVLCAIILAVSLRSHQPQLAEIDVRDASPEHHITSVEAYVPPRAAPLDTLPPDFLEPLPLLEPTPATEPSEIEREAADAALPPPALESPVPVLPSLEQVTLAPRSSPLAPRPVDPVLPSLDEVTSESEPLPAIEDDPSVPLESPAADVTEEVPPVNESEILAVEPVEYDEDAELAAQVAPQELLTFSPAVAEISQKMLPEVRAAFALAQHGATHAAHAKFIHVLRRIAQVKDAEAMTERHTRSLADGLRALEEGDDFMPEGGVAPTLDLETIAATHQTPMLRVHQSRYTLTHEAVALYHRYAQQKLGAAVEGEQAGSMALHGLGQIHARWADTEEASLADTRHSMTMYRAALVAHPRNHLAANELGVTLARSGRYDQAVVPLDWAAQLAGTSTIYHNLAVVQQHRGQMALAQTAKVQAERLALLERASGEVSRRHGIQWVAPQDLARVSDGHAAEAATPPATIAPPAKPRQSTFTPAPRGGTWR